MTSSRVETRFWPRDVWDVLLGGTFALFFVLAFNFAPALGVTWLARIVGCPRPVLLPLFGGTYLLVAAILVSVTVLRIEVVGDGLRFVRVLGSPRFVKWDDIEEVSLASRLEVLIQGWLWPPWPPREATPALTTTGHVRLSFRGKLRYFAPSDPDQFLAELAGRGVRVVGTSRTPASVARPVVQPHEAAAEPKRRLSGAGGE